MLTHKEVKARSKTLEGAIAVSKQHWYQMAVASDDFLDKTSITLIRSDYCGLCQHCKRIKTYEYCHLCPYDCQIGTTWHKAFVAYNNRFWNIFREYAAEIAIELGKL